MNIRLQLKTREHGNGPWCGRKHREYRGKEIAPGALSDSESGSAIALGVLQGTGESTFQSRYSGLKPILCPYCRSPRFSC